MEVILISGKAQHGKDTTATIIKTELEGSGHRVLVAHYADLVKYVCGTFFGWNGRKDAEGRSLLQYVGTDAVRRQRPFFWVEFIDNILTLFPEEWDYVIIPDTRFPNEVSYWGNTKHHAIHLRVVRDNFDSGLTAEQLQHASEVALDNVEPDFYISNNGCLVDLRQEILELMRSQAWV